MPNTNIGDAADTFRHYIELLYAKTQGCELGADSKSELAEAVAAFRDFERATPRLPTSQQREVTQ